MAGRDGHGIQGAWLNAGEEVEPAIVGAHLPPASGLDGHDRRLRQERPRTRTTGNSIVIDNYHGGQLATKALDEVRREHCERAAPRRQADTAKQFKHDRWALLKNPRRAHRPASHHPRRRSALAAGSSRAGGRQGDGADNLAPGLSVDAVTKLLEPTARPPPSRCRLPPLIRFGQNDPQAHKEILATRRLKLSNARAEAINNKRQAYPPRLRIPLRRSRTRARSSHLRTGHPDTPTRTSARMNPPTIMPGEPEISHSALLERVRDRVKDNTVLALVKAFLKAGILSERITSDGTRTPARRKRRHRLAAVGEHRPLGARRLLPPNSGRTVRVERAKRRRHGDANYRLVRYADDFVVMVSGTREQAESHRKTRSPPVLSATWPVSMRGLDFLGWHIQGQDRRGATTDHRVIYTYPSKKALRAIMEKVRAAIRQVGTDLSLGVLLHRLEPCAAGLDQLLPGRSVERQLSIPQRLHLAPSDWLDTTQAPPDHLEATPEPLLLRRMVGGRGRGRCSTRRRCGPPTTATAEPRVPSPSPSNA